MTMKPTTEFAAPKTPAIVDVPPAKYVAVAGRGAPEGESFEEAIAALYAAAFTIKMTRKKSGGENFTVSKLEARWWAEPEGRDFAKAPRAEWRWEVLIRVPDSVTARELAAAVRALEAKGKTGVERVALLKLKEGRCVQMLHVGPYATEAATIAAMKAFAEENGLAFRGRHHEIYLSDPRRVAPEKLRTILRMPVG